MTSFNVTATEVDYAPQDNSPSDANSTQSNEGGFYGMRTPSAKADAFVRALSDVQGLAFTENPKQLVELFTLQFEIINFLTKHFKIDPEDINQQELIRSATTSLSRLMPNISDIELLSSGSFIDTVLERCNESLLPIKDEFSYDILSEVKIELFLLCHSIQLQSELHGIEPPEDFIRDMADCCISVTKDIAFNWSGESDLTDRTFVFQSLLRVVREIIELSVKKQILASVKALDAEVALPAREFIFSDEFTDVLSANDTLFFEDESLAETFVISSLELFRAEVDQYSEGYRAYAFDRLCDALQNRLEDIFNAFETEYEGLESEGLDDEVMDDRGAAMVHNLRLAISTAPQDAITKTGSTLSESEIFPSRSEMQHLVKTRIAKIWGITDVVLKKQTA
ncbi:hypothetical protein [Neptuniibacter sp. QD37_11]|uniref:hypothetical protein n=1 Tax=Neptuniibacter sp. QD37_11 TaxID=3398209 RepID=UPI0039F50901